MTNTTNPQSDAPLGVGSLIGDSFTILFRHFLTVVLLAVVPTLIGLTVSGMLVGLDTALGFNQPETTDVTAFTPLLISILVQFVVYGLTSGLLVQMAYDAKLERPLQPSRYFDPALRAVFPLSILSVAVALMVALGFAALVVPGLWVYAVFCVMPVAVVIEKAGFGGLGRSASLTKGYRWPICGTLILSGIIVGLFNFAASYLVGVLIVQVSGGVAGPIGVLAYGFLTAVANGLTAILIALIYARLREIKEGVSVSDISAVFD